MTKPGLITLIYLVLCLILLAGCAGSMQTVEPFEDGHTTEIQEDNQVEFQHLTVGVKNFQKEPCVDNPKKKCLSAGVGCGFRAKISRYPGSGTNRPGDH